MITADTSKCIGCGICVSVCPFSAIHMENGAPKRTDGKFCIECMHCAAACPKDAILFNGASASYPAPEPVGKDFAGELDAFLRMKRSYRHFEPRPVERDVLEHALRTADFAPSAKNRHKVRWIVINDRKKLEDIFGIILKYTVENNQSPEIAAELAIGNNVVICTAHTMVIGVSMEGALNAPVDTFSAMTSLELCLQANGVGTCWAGYFGRLSNTIAEIPPMLGIREGEKIIGALMAGYPTGEKYLRLPARNTADIEWM